MTLRPVLQISIEEETGKVVLSSNTSDKKSMFWCLTEAMRAVIQVMPQESDILIAKPNGQMPKEILER